MGIRRGSEQDRGAGAVRTNGRPFDFPAAFGLGPEQVVTAAAEQRGIERRADRRGETVQQGVDHHVKRSINNQTQCAIGIMFADQHNAIGKGWINQSGHGNQKMIF